MKGFGSSVVEDAMVFRGLLKALALGFPFGGIAGYLYLEIGDVEISRSLGKSSRLALWDLLGSRTNL